MRLHLVRHLPPLVDAGVCYGRTDLGTDPAAQALSLPALRAALPLHAPIYSSPLQRCAVLARALGDPVMLDARLAELDFGSWEMQPWDTIPRADIDAWAADVAAYRPGGGESVADMALRIAAFYADINATGVRDAIVVCHAGTIRLLTARAAGMDVQAMAQAAAAHPHRIAYGEIVTIACV
jgi:alpha-ribazole phosphatase